MLVSFFFKRGATDSSNKVLLEIGSYTKKALLSWISILLRVSIFQVIFDFSLTKSREKISLEFVVNGG